MERISVVIPFYRRHRHLSRVLHGLADQTFPLQQCEIVVAAFRPDNELRRLCRHSNLPIRIEPVVRANWNVAAARNAGLSVTRGDLLVLLDADVVPQPDFLSIHLAHHGESPQIVVGRVLSYDPYVTDSGSHARIWRMQSTHGLLESAWKQFPSDARWALDLQETPLPWALCWSGNLSVPRLPVERKTLYFDERFKGWGGEDLEWAYRLHRHGFAIRFCPQAWGTHLPHDRSISNNVSSEQANFREFLWRHPTFEVEVITWLNDIGANLRFSAIATHVRRQTGGNPYWITYTPDCSTIRFGQRRSPVEHMSLPLLGLSVPFEDSAFGRAEVATWLLGFPSDVRTRILEEACRVAQQEVVFVNE